MANSAYTESDEGHKVRTELVGSINEQYDDAIDWILHHDERQHIEDEAMAHPMIQAGIRAFENSKWEYQAAIETRAALGI